METLTKLLDNAADRIGFGLHPQCHNPKLTHLLFADDLLVFSDGSRNSLNIIFDVLQHFKSLSGLDMNPTKSEIFLSGYDQVYKEAASEEFGISMGAFPTRYLGLPLNTKRLSFTALQPFLEKITAKIHTWTASVLSFAGKIRLISSVIYGMVNFWSQVYILPKEFYAKVDSLSSAFLWKNKSQSSPGARVSWKDVCKPKSEGGLGIRLLEDFQLVFRLKQIWNLFTNAGSLWVAWVRGNVFNRKSYWVSQDSPRFSRTIRSMLQLKPMLTTFLKCIVHDGRTASFWFDPWTEHGPLIDFIGITGPTQLRISLDSRVVDAQQNGQWSLPPARSDNIQSLLLSLIEINPPAVTLGSDTYLWRSPSGNFSPRFSSRGTWEQLRTKAPSLAWPKAVWFKEAIPRFSFILWLANLKRLPTRDRLLNWGMVVPQACVLCSTGLESHDHLFLECEFSSHLWLVFATRVGLPAATRLADVISTLALTQQPRSPQAIILKLLLQVITYSIWTERNKRIFTGETQTLSVIKSSIDRTMRNRLLSFPAASFSSVSLLEFYFGCISFPL